MGRLAGMLGRESGAPRIVRPARSGVRAALIVAGVLLGVFALYVVYELGRYNAGYDRQAVAQQRTELEVRIEHLERANRPRSWRSTGASWRRAPRASASRSSSCASPPVSRPGPMSCTCRSCGRGAQMRRRPGPCS
ncbi:MAG: hypothetical protein E6K38_01620 [Gammaproteobacteria bacterium]|nr:MAG: hypothetical protein E6K38_01620 [Gammaproteobacteria bacterium]